MLEETDEQITHGPTLYKGYHGDNYPHMTPVLCYLTVLTRPNLYILGNVILDLKRSYLGRSTN